MAGGRREAKAAATWEVVRFLRDCATCGRDLLVGGIEVGDADEGHDCAGGILGVDTAGGAGIAGVGVVVAVHGVGPAEDGGEEVTDGVQFLDGRGGELDVVNVCVAHGTSLENNGSRGRHATTRIE